MKNRRSISEIIREISLLESEIEIINRELIDVVGDSGLNKRKTELNAIRKAVKKGSINALKWALNTGEITTL